MEKKEAMKILKDFHDKSALFSVRTALDVIIPELKGNEDEDIKKAILELVRQSSEVLDKQNQNNMIAWLEKQGYTKKDVDDAYLKGICHTKHELEKQGEQESADKHEPKFKNGQWIVWQNKCYKVNYNGCGYGLIDQNGLSTSLEYGTVDTSARLWNITKDAKDGDVLYSLDTYQPFIYKARNIHEQATAYCGINKYGKFFVWNTNDCIITLDKYIPATKEQRDTLLKAMADAGYTFDFESKELKKIEHKSTDRREPKFKVGDWVTNGIETVQITGYDIDYGYQVDYKGKLQHRDTDIIEKEYHLWTIQDVKHDDVLVVNWDNGYKLDDKKKELKKLSQRMISAEAKEALYDKPTDEEMKELLRTEYEKGRADTIAKMYVPTQISPEESLGVSSEKYMAIVDTFTQGGQKPAKWSLEDERVIAIINNALTESNTQPDDYDKVYDWLESLKQRIKSYE